MGIAITLHLFAVMIWIGGMFFAYLVLRPSAKELLDSETRLNLWNICLSRFFAWVWLSVITILLSGLHLIFSMGSMADMGIHIHIMMLTGGIMMFVFVFIFFIPYRILKKSIEAKDWFMASTALDQIRQLVLLNLLLGVMTLIIASSGRNW